MLGVFAEGDVLGHGDQKCMYQVFQMDVLLVLSPLFDEIKDEVNLLRKASLLKYAHCFDKGLELQARAMLVEKDEGHSIKEEQVFIVEHGLTIEDSGHICTSLGAFLGLPPFELFVSFHAIQLEVVD